MICSFSFYGSKFLMMAIAISSLTSASHADLRQQENMEKTREESRIQCFVKIQKEALYGSIVWNTLSDGIRIVGNTIYEIEYLEDQKSACPWKWKKRAEISVERIYRLDDWSPPAIPYKEVWHIEGPDLCRYSEEFDSVSENKKKTHLTCRNLKTGEINRRRGR